MSGQSTVTDQATGARPAYARWRDVFVLPSTTAGRFLVLAAVLFVGAIPFYQWWAYYTVRITPDLADCGAIPPGADPAAYVTQLSLCPAEVNRTVTVITLALAAAVPLVAVLIYRLWPRVHELRA